MSDNHSDSAGSCMMILPRLSAGYAASEDPPLRVLGKHCFCEAIHPSFVVSSAVCTRRSKHVCIRTLSGFPSPLRLSITIVQPVRATIFYCLRKHPMRLPRDREPLQHAEDDQRPECGNSLSVWTALYTVSRVFPAVIQSHHPEEYTTSLGALGTGPNLSSKLLSQHHAIALGL